MKKAKYLATLIMVMLLTSTMIMPVFAAPFVDIVDRNSGNLSLLSDGGYKFKPSQPSDTKVPDWCGKIVYYYKDGNSYLTKTLTEPAADLPIYNVIEATLYVKGSPSGGDSSDRAQVTIEDKSSLTALSDGGYKYKAGNRTVKLQVPTWAGKIVYYQAKDGKTITVENPKSGDWLDYLSEATIYPKVSEATQVSIQDKNNLTKLSDGGYKYQPGKQVQLQVPTWAKKIVYWDGSKTVTVNNPTTGTYISLWEATLYQ